MKISRTVAGIACWSALFLVPGCGPRPWGQMAGRHASPSQPTLGFAPARIAFTPWTEIKGPAQGEGKRQIRVFVRLVDAFDCDVKAPGGFRFELYEKLPRSVQPRGKRLMIWPDFDLAVAEQNNAYWRDFVRSYEFTLDLESSEAGTYILEATFIPPEGRRLTAQYLLTSQK